MIPNKCTICESGLKTETIQSNDKVQIHEHLYCPEHPYDGFYCLTKKVGVRSLRNFS